MLTAMMEREITRLLNLKKSCGVPYEDYLHNPNLMFVERKTCANHSLEWLKKTYENVCNTYGYMPIEFAYNDVDQPQFNIFCSFKRTFTGKEKKSYFAVYTDKR